MPDEDLIQYIKEHRKKYSIEKLKKGLLKQGVSKKEIEEAISLIEKEDKKDALDVSKEQVYKKGIDKGILDTGLKIVGVAKSERSFYNSVIIYGAISFVFLDIIVTVFEYISGRIVYGKVAAELGALGRLALPGVFVINVNLFSVVLSLIWSALLGGVIAFIFFRYLIILWPFRLWSTLFKKVFAFYLIIELFFGIFINGILITISPVYLTGYLLIISGMVFASYIAAFYLVSNLERKHSRVLGEILRKGL